MTPSPDPQDLADLNDLLAALEDDPDTREGLMREHIEAARTYLTLAMPEEYRLALRLAASALGDVPDTALRDRITQFLQKQLKHP
jgi:hypothetical protein